MERTITTDEAARLAGVTASTIKRWADEGLLPCVKTAGGHRRFRVEDVRSFVSISSGRGSLLSSAPTTADDWIRIWRSGTPSAIDASLLLARGALGSWYGVADSVGRVVTELGEQWAANRIRVVDEHIVSHALQRSLGRIADSRPVSPDAPRCALATPNGELHVLGLALAELCLREAGWNTIWLGASTPAEDLVTLLEAGEIQLIALSGSRFSSDRPKLQEYLSLVEPTALQRRIPVVTGGTAAWPDRAPHMKSFEELYRFALSQLPSRRPAAEVA